MDTMSTNIRSKFPRQSVHQRVVRRSLLQTKVLDGLTLSSSRWTATAERGHRDAVSRYQSKSNSEGARNSKQTVSLVYSAVTLEPLKRHECN
ncbi:hypothetical protein F2P81_025065 [Scophthalmus maximus]|uniref:Uncharacterized protein n=1 Tax=Scophthalmus maximus TaxID=52904 RepID=A0A6A4RLE1_SCOMX|nr:hypothetical protein F2P81_025065 [Scophthalmus maximus]